MGNVVRNKTTNKYTLVGFQDVYDDHKCQWNGIIPDHDASDKYISCGHLETDAIDMNYFK